MSSVKLVLANKSNKNALQDWEDFLESIRNTTTVDASMSAADIAKHKAELEKPGNEEEWFKFFFPKFCFCEPAAFQKRSTKKVLKAKRLYQRRAWARGLAKSTRRMMEIFYKIFVQKLRGNMLLVSKNESNAIRLLAPYRANLEANQRLIKYYGVQQGSNKWAEEEFITRGKSSFRAVGMGQNPRGARLDELRINILCFDDADDDEVCRNPERLQQWWEWIEKSAIPTVDISADYFIFFDNNIIAEDSLAVRAAQYADDVELVNIRENDKSVWPEKNSEKDIDDILDKMSYESSQGEYFNNPMSQGKTFKEMIYGKCPPLKQLDFVVQYADPAPSNKDKPSIKSKAQNSCKAVVLIGYNNLKFYVYKAYVDNTTNSNFIDWMYAINDYAKDAKLLYSFIENNTLQNPHYEQVLLPLLFEKGKENKGVLGITPDDREKPDKWARIEGTLEPLNRLGLLILNEDEKNNPHMQRLAAQFLAAKSTSKELGAPDAVEGGVFKLKIMIAVAASDGLQIIPRSRNKSKSY